MEEVWYGRGVLGKKCSMEEVYYETEEGKMYTSNKQKVYFLECLCNEEFWSTPSPGRNIDHNHPFLHRKLKGSSSDHPRGGVSNPHNLKPDMLPVIVFLIWQIKPQPKMHH